MIRLVSCEGCERGMVVYCFKHLKHKLIMNINYSFVDSM
jgi:hypothetical protein